MMKKGYRLALAILMLCIIPLTVRAGENGSIRIHLNVGDLPVINGAFTAVRVGSPISDGYRIDGKYGGGFVREEDAQSPHLAQWLSDQNVTQGTTVLLDADGNGIFSDLQDGLYLLSQTENTDGFYPIQPFLLTLPSEERRNITVYLDPLPIVADSPATGQLPAVYWGIAGMTLSLGGLLVCWYIIRKNGLSHHIAA